MAQESLKRLSKKDLADRRDRLLRNVEIANPSNAASLVLQALIYIQELAAREQRRQANIMVFCTIIISILTAVMTWATLATLYQHS